MTQQPQMTHETSVTDPLVDIDDKYRPPPAIEPNQTRYRQTAAGLYRCLFARINDADEIEGFESMAQNREGKNG